jgi:hypothetical protein
MGLITSPVEGDLKGKERDEKIVERKRAPIRVAKVKKLAR